MPSILQNTSTKFLATGALLVSLIISNAYKNDNMYELLNPRKFRSFNEFNQLRDANYSTYSLPLYADLEPTCFVNITDLSKCIQESYGDNHMMYSNNLRIKSKLFKYMEPYNSVFKSPKLLQYAYNYSTTWMLKMEWNLQWLMKS